MGFGGYFWAGVGTLSAAACLLLDWLYAKANHRDPLIIRLSDRYPFTTMTMAIVLVVFSPVLACCVFHVIALSWVILNGVSLPFW